jgi:hypothetical protein
VNKPAKEIDGAKVLLWAWSGSVPFGKVSDIEIYGLAICQYENSDDIYRFSCDKNWETQQDGLYSSIEQAVEQLPDQYKNVTAKWTIFQ